MRSSRCVPVAELMTHGRAEFGRYLINGVAATAVHFGILTFNLHVLQFPSAGVANFVAALFGITASFLGNRYFVFRDHSDPLLQQLWRFAILYSGIACMHAGLLFVWTDRMGYDYRIGFVIATGLQLGLSYL